MRRKLAFFEPGKAQVIYVPHACPPGWQDASALPSTSYSDSDGFPTLLDSQDAETLRTSALLAGHSGFGRRLPGRFIEEETAVVWANGTFHFLPVDSANGGMLHMPGPRDFNTIYGDGYSFLGGSNLFRLDLDSAALEPGIISNVEGLDIGGQGKLIGRFRRRREAPLPR